jgi:carbonic anhydrase
MLGVFGFGINDPEFVKKIRDKESVIIPKEEAKKFNLGKQLNDITHHITYSGSLTTPPCTEGVQWFILLEKLKVSQKQLDYFPILFGKETNVRGLQPLNNRILSII